MLTVKHPDELSLLDVKNKQISKLEARLSAAYRENAKLRNKIKELEAIILNPSDFAEALIADSLED